MHVALLCATERGRRLLQVLGELAQGDELTVFSFREEPWEPPFLDDIRGLAEQLGARFIEAKKVQSASCSGFWKNTQVDLMLVQGWRYLIPKEIYQQVARGAYVFHDSLLPAYRGFSPTVWSIINGEDHTGVSLFEIDEGVDSGAVVDQQRVDIGERDTIRTVMQSVTAAYIDVLRRNYHALTQGVVTTQQQDHEQATYTTKRKPADGLIDWGASARDIYNLVRALTQPYTGAFTTLDGRRLYIWAARLGHEQEDGRAAPGTIVTVTTNDEVVVQTGDGTVVLEVTEFEDHAEPAFIDVVRGQACRLGR